MRVYIRADASAQIGAGHVMRCLTLADALRERGASITFVSRDMPAALADLIKQKGHAPEAIEGADVSHVLPILEEAKPDWLIVDHYGLDIEFEQAVRACCGRVMVIDDLADRRHDCDLLLDQNLGRTAEDYAGLVPANCALLIGPHFALLRPEFARTREASIRRRVNVMPQNILISLGGFDADNVTGAVLSALKSCSLPSSIRLSVVMGSDAPWIERVREIAQTMPWQTTVFVGVRDMASIMAASDLAIGAAGGAAFERAVLGLPTLLIILADNQRPGAHALERSGAARLVPEGRPVSETLCAELRALMEPTALAAASSVGAALTEGRGAPKVAAAILEYS